MHVEMGVRYCVVLFIHMFVQLTEVGTYMYYALVHMR